MTELSEALVRQWQENLSEEERTRLEQAANQIVNFAIKVREVGQAIGNTLVRAAERTEMNYNRGALLCLYSQRHTWKKADLARIKTYQLSKVALKRVIVLEASKRVGRGTTAEFQPLVEKLIQAGRYFTELFDPATKPHRRLFLLKQHPSWWPQFVEMTYRGEYARLKELGGPAPSDQAELAVAQACYMSQSSVRRLCNIVRSDLANLHSISESINVAEFEAWKVSGQLPENRRAAT